MTRRPQDWCFWSVCLLSCLLAGLPAAAAPQEAEPQDPATQETTDAGENNSTDDADADSDEEADRDSRSPRPSFNKQSADLIASIEPIVAAAQKVTVSIVARGRPVALGTIVDSDGLILTKASELRNGLTCKLPDGRSLSAEVFGIHQNTDLALLKVDATDLPMVDWSDTEPPPVGYWLVTPKFEAPPLLGIVSVKPRTIRAPNGYVGIQMSPHAKGIRIDRVFSDSAAENAGLQVNDIIIEFNGAAVSDQNALREAIKQHSVGSEVRMKVLRGQNALDFELHLTDDSVFGGGTNRSDVQNEMGGRLSRRRLDFPMALQHDTPLAANDCGGPVVDLSGKVIGINIARAGRVDTLALPSETILSVLDRLKSGELSPTVVHQSEIEKIKKRLAEVAGELEQLPQKGDELSQTLDRDNSRLEELRKEMDDVQKQLADLEAVTAQTTKELESVKENLSSLQKEKERLEEKLQKLISGTN